MKEARDRQSILRKPKASGGEIAPQPAQKKIKKEERPSSELKKLYSALVVVAARKKNRAQTEELNKAIDAFLNYVKSRSHEFITSIMGSRGIQFCLKYGTTAHRQTILLYVMKHNVLKVMNARYGTFIFSKLFKFCKHEPGFKALSQFIQANTTEILKLTDGFLVIGAYVDSLSHAAQFDFHFEKIKTIKWPPFFVEEFIAQNIYKKKYLLSSFCHSFMLNNFDKLKEKKQDLFENLVNFFYISARKTASLIPLLGLICKLFGFVGWESRKLLLKSVVTKKFVEYYRREPCVIYLLFLLLARVKNTKVLDLTLISMLRDNFTDIAADMLTVKIFVYLIAEPRFFFQDVTFNSGKALNELLEVKQQMESDLFESNRKYVSDAIFTSETVTSLLNYESIVLKSSENSTFAIFYGLLVEWMMKKSDFLSAIDKIFKQLFTKASEEVRSLSDDASKKVFLTSPIGHRLYKKIIQSLKSASEENKLIVEKHLREFFGGIQTNLEILTKTKGVFVLIAIIEHSEIGEKARFALSKLNIVSQNSEYPGLKILAGLLK